MFYRSCGVFEIPRAAVVEHKMVSLWVTVRQFGYVNRLKSIYYHRYSSFISTFFPFLFIQFILSFSESEYSVFSNLYFEFVFIVCLNAKLKSKKKMPLKKIDWRKGKFKKLGHYF